MSFNQIQSEFGVPNKDFFAYLQVRHFIEGIIRLPLDRTVRSPLDVCLIRFSKPKGFISYFYNFMNTFNKHDISQVIATWERDLESEYNEAEWTKCILSCSSTFCCNKFKETQYRILHRQHRTPYLLNKFDPSRSSLCSKCKEKCGTYIHCFWQCSTIAKFWSEISLELNNIFKSSIEMTPGLFLLSLPERNTSLNTSNVLLLQKLLVLARRCILLNWVSEKPPTVTQWYREIFRILPMEKLNAKLKNDEQLYVDTWKPFLDHMPRDVANLCV